MYLSNAFWRSFCLLLSDTSKHLFFLFNVSITLTNIVENLTDVVREAQGKGRDLTTRHFGKGSLSEFTIQEPCLGEAETSLFFYSSPTPLLNFYLCWFLCFLHRFPASCICSGTRVHTIVASCHIKTLPFERTLDTWPSVIPKPDAARVSLINERSRVHNPAGSALNQHGHCSTEGVRWIQGEGAFSERPVALLYRQTLS